MSPLAGWRDRFDACSEASLDLRLHEAPFLTQILLRIDAQDPSAAAIQQALGVSLPMQFGTCTQAAELDVMWLGPDEWLLVAPQGAAERLLNAVAEAAGQAHYMVLDISANRTCIEMRGSDARYVLAKGCHDDLHAQVFTGRRCVQTLVAKVPVILQLKSDAPVIRLLVRNSFAAHLAQWLIDAAGEIVAARRHGHDELRGRLGAALAAGKPA